MFSPNGFIIFVTMKRMILLLICAMSAASCNPGVFIEPLEVERAVYDVPFYGGTVDIAVRHGDWELERVAYNNVDLGFVEDADGVLWHEDNFISLHISRPQPSKLLVTIVDSVNPDAGVIEVFIRNDYESEVVTVNVGACSGYSFDRVEYGMHVVVSGDNAFEQVWSRTVNNGSGQPMGWECPVFDDGFCRTVWFPASTVVSGDMPYVMWYDTLMKFVGKPFDVPVPAPFLSDGTLSFFGEEVGFSYDQIVQPIEFIQSDAAVTLAPGANTVKMYWGYVEYEVPYTMWFTHSGGGRDLCFSGVFTSKAYNGEWRVEL